MKEVVILVGNIGCGKTTLTKILSSQYVIVSRDSFRYGIGAGRYTFNTIYEPAIINTALSMVDEFLKIEVPIVIDEVNVSKEYRSKYIEKAKAHGYKVTAIVLPRLSMKEAVDRRMNNPHDQRDRGLWENVWTKFDSKYQEPSVEEGFDNIIKIGDNK